MRRVADAASLQVQNLLHHEDHEFDVCVVGGGMAGMCAAIAAARNGAKTALVHDRPVLGGNASSEVRMWICGAHGAHNKETGILEETQLENQYRNPTANYSVWDSVLYGKVAFQPGLTPFLNCTCTDAEMDGERIVGIRAWQLTSQTWHTIRARLFVDCSGDSILAAVTGAEFRQGREARAEFDEDIQPEAADRKTMGNTLLIQVRRTDEPQPYVAPRWAYKFTSEADLPHRIQGVSAHNFWWLEIGGLQDTIRDAETIRDGLMKIGYGVWDYLKNHAPKRAQAENWALEWLGSLPGKRAKTVATSVTTSSPRTTCARGATSRTSLPTAAGRWTTTTRRGCIIPGIRRSSTPRPRRTASPTAACIRATCRISSLPGATFP